MKVDIDLKNELQEVLSLICGHDYLTMIAAINKLDKIITKIN